MIRPVLPSDISELCTIYNHYVRNTVITFEEANVPEQEMQRRVTETTLRYPWLVYEHNNTVIGYAYATHWKVRSAYRFSAESTIYLHPDHTQKGIGKVLYTSLIGELGKTTIHSLIGGIALPNPSSIALHERLGFRKCAQFNQVGYKFGQWIDVGYWEKHL